MHRRGLTSLLRSRQLTELLPPKSKEEHPNQPLGARRALLRKRAKRKKEMLARKRT